MKSVTMLFTIFFIIVFSIGCSRVKGDNTEITHGDSLQVLLDRANYSSAEIHSSMDYVIPDSLKSEARKWIIELVAVASANVNSNNYDADDLVDEASEAATRHFGEVVRERYLWVSHKHMLGAYAVHKNEMTQRDSALFDFLLQS